MRWNVVYAISLTLVVVLACDLMLGHNAYSQSALMHFKLLGPDWARIPKGYYGVVPERVVLELNIPKEYVALISLGADETSNVSVEFFYPSMKGAVQGQSSEARVRAILSAGREEGFRSGTHQLVFADGMTHNPDLDLNGLCGYVDKTHPGLAGQEWYTSCDESEQIFSIVCFPPFNNRRVCTDDQFIGSQIGAQLFYQYELLRERGAIANSFKSLTLSFIQSVSRENN